MLIKDGKVWEIPAEDMAKVRAMFPRFYGDKPENVYLDYDPSKIKIGKDGRQIKPPSMGLSVSADVLINGNLEKITWCKTKEVDSRTGNTTTSPCVISVQDRHSLTPRRDDDKLAFMALYHPQVGNNMADKNLKTSSSVNFYLPKKIANDRFQAIRLLSKAKALILDESVLGNSEVRQIAKAMFITGVDEMSTSEIRVYFHDTLFSDKNKSHAKHVEDFLNISENEELIVIRSIIQRAQEQKIIRHNLDTNEWMKLDDDGNDVGVLTRYKRGSHAEKALVSWFMANPNDYNNVKVDTEAFVAEDDLEAREAAVALDARKIELREKELALEKEEIRLKKLADDNSREKQGVGAGESLGTEGKVDLLSSLDFKDDKAGKIAFGRHKNKIIWTIANIEEFFHEEDREYYNLKKQELIESLG